MATPKQLRFERYLRGEMSKYWKDCANLANLRVLSELTIQYIHEATDLSNQSQFFLDDLKVKYHKEAKKYL